MISLRSELFFTLLIILLSTSCLLEAGTIHSSLGTGETNRGWKPGGKRSMDCSLLQSEALLSILEVVKEEAAKISMCERVHYEEKAVW